LGSGYWDGKRGIKHINIWERAFRGNYNSTGRPKWTQFLPPKKQGAGLSSENIVIIPKCKKKR